MLSVQLVAFVYSLFWLVCVISFVRTAWGLVLTARCASVLVLRKRFVPNRDERIWEWRRLHNEELYVLYSPPNIIRVIKSRRDWRDM